MKNLVILTAALSLSWATISCKKGSTPTPTNETAELVGKKWFQDKIVYKSQTQDTEHTVAFKDCEKDDFLLFQASGILTYDKGEVACNNIPALAKTGIWSLDKAQNVLKTNDLKNMDNAISWKIAAHNSDVLVLETQTELFNETMKITLFLKAETTVATF